MKQAQGPDEHVGSTEALKNNAKKELLAMHAEESNTKNKTNPDSQCDGNICRRKAKMNHMRTLHEEISTQTEKQRKERFELAGRVNQPARKTTRDCLHQHKRGIEWPVNGQHLTEEDININLNLHQNI